MIVLSVCKHLKIRAEWAMNLDKNNYLIELDQKTPEKDKVLTS